MGQLPTFIDLGFDSSLNRGDSFVSPDILLPTGSDLQGSSLTGGSVNGTENLVTEQVQPSSIASGEVAEHVIIAADGHIRGGATAYLEGDGFWLGSFEGDKLDYRFFIGDVSSNYLTYANGVLTIVGSISVSAGGTIGGFEVGADYVRDVANTFGLVSTVTGGNDIRLWAGSSFASRATAPFRVYEDGSIVATSATITIASLGGFDIGSDYIRDAANSFGLASTVTGGDDVRIWAGSTFASRATAPFRVTEAGVVVATSATITGAITATSGAIAGWTIAAAELSSGSVKIQSTAERVLLGSATAPLTGIGVFLGKDGSDYELRVGDPADKYLHWDGSTLVGDFDNLTKDGTQVIPGYSLTAYDTTLDRAGGGLLVGYNDDTTPFIVLGSHSGSGSGGYIAVKYGTETTGGASPLYITLNSYASAGNWRGILFIGTAVWASTNAAGANMQKNGSSVSFSGTQHFGPLSYDSNNSYLLVLYSTTVVARYSGVSGTTITYVDDITLDTAVSSDVGYIFDRVNSRYICADKTNNLVRRFNSSGTTIDTQSYTFNDNQLQGLVVVDNRVYAVVGLAIGSSSVAPLISVNLVPTDMTI